MADRFVDDYLLYLLARASSEVSAQFHVHLKAHGLQVPEWRVLASLSDSDSMTVGELAAHALQRQPTMTKIIDRMAESGLIERRQDEADRRKVRIFITGAGQRRVDDALADAKRHEREVLSDYLPAEARSLKSVLRALIDRNGATPQDD